MKRSERQELLGRLQHDAFRIASHFGLRYQAVVAENPKVTSRYGICYEDGLIKIRLNHAKTGQPLKYSSLIDTLCHELAHLRHFDHSPEFREFFFQLLAWARRQGIYRPDRRRTRDPGSPRPEREATAHRPQDLHLAPPRRNGVPIFPAEEQGTANLSLPWEIPPQPRPALRPARKPSSRPATPRKQAPAGQLSLF